jgi:uncharacterized protein
MIAGRFPGETGMSFDIRHNAAAQRFETTVEGALCELDYRLAGGTMTITHTGVPPQLEGRGIASAMTQAAMETARANGWKVIPACSYAVTWLRRHPQFDDLRA